MALAVLHQRTDRFQRILGVFELHVLVLRYFVTQTNGGRSKVMKWKMGDWKDARCLFFHSSIPHDILL